MRIAWDAVKRMQYGSKKETSIITCFCGGRFGILSFVMCGRQRKKIALKGYPAALSEVERKKSVRRIYWQSDMNEFFGQS